MTYSESSIADMTAQGMTLIHQNWPDMRASLDVYAKPEVDAMVGGGSELPVGSVYTNTGADPDTELGYGNWQLMGFKDFTDI